MRIDAYAQFIARSNGEWNGLGEFIGNPEGFFDPREFTQIVRQEPFRCFKAGEPNGKGRINKSSSWSSEKIEVAGDDVYQVCDNLVEKFVPYIDGLIAFKNKFDVVYQIDVILYKVGIETNGVFFGERVIEFCHKTGTVINVNTMLADENGWDKDLEKE